MTLFTFSMTAVCLTLSTPAFSITTCLSYSFNTCILHNNLLSYDSLNTCIVTYFLMTISIRAFRLFQHLHSPWQFTFLWPVFSITTYFLMTLSTPAFFRNNILHNNSISHILMYFPHCHVTKFLKQLIFNTCNSLKNYTIVLLT